METTLILSVLSSTVMAAVVAGFITLFKTKVDYKNDFYKILIQKRIETYDMIEQLLYVFSTSVIDYNDKKLYHIIFNNSEMQNIYSNILPRLSKSNIWIGSATDNAITELNRFIVSNNIDFKNIDQGKKYYFDLGVYRDKILLHAKSDILLLHDIKKELKKNIKKGIVDLEIK